ncbi:MAG: single-stranded DNA-binding protein [bacterium]
MLNINRAQILGNLTKDPEMRYTPNGQAVTSFSVATNRRWKGRDGAADGEATEYHEIVVWGKQAETITPMLKKGEPVFIEGRLQTRSWEGQDGAKRYKTEIVAETVIVLGGRGGAQSANSYSAAPAEDSKPASKSKAKVEEEEIDIEDIPF